MRPLPDSLLRDLRSATRALAARPGWTAAATLCLAIATGANTAAFTLVNGLLLRPLPFEEPDRLVMVALREPTQGAARPFSLREYRDLAERSAGTTALLARTYFPLSLVSEDGSGMAQTELVSGNYFDLLGVRPFAGRFFDESTDREGSPPLAVLSHALWQRRFGADPGVIGRSVRVNGRPAIIAGVAPPDFVGAMRIVAADLWLPAVMYPDLARSPDASSVPMFGVMGRLAAALTPADASARLTAIATGLSPAAGREAAPAVIVTPAAGFGVPVAVHGAILTLSGFVYVMMALLMAVACANVAALVLARGAGRGREIAVRLSLGATRTQIARQLITESAVLALAGCAAGSLVAVWLTQAMVARLTTPFQYVSYAIDVHPDLRVLAYSVVATIGAAVLCGIAPIRVARRVDIIDVLKQSAARGRPGQPMRVLNAMVVVQFAVSTALLAAAGMLVRSYVHAQSTHVAFDTAGLVACTLDADQAGLDRAAGIRLYQAAMERLLAHPVVVDVALTRDAPSRPGRTAAVVADGDRRVQQPGGRISAAAMAVSPQYFRTLGVAVRQGRSFHDNEPARPLTAVVNDAMARRLWPGTSALGRTFRLDRAESEPIEVVGVVPDLGDIPSGGSPQPAFYQPFPQVYAPRMTVLARVQGDPHRFLAEVQRTVRELNQDLSIVDLRTVDELLAIDARQRETPAFALALVGMLGLVLSAVGLYGVVAYGVRERARELGIRLALGARPDDVRRLVLRQGFATVGLGLAVGTAATVAFIQVLRSVVPGASALDPATLAAVCAVLAATGSAALYLPARWASALDPAHTLRSE